MEVKSVALPYRWLELTLDGRTYRFRNVDWQMYRTDKGEIRVRTLSPEAAAFAEALMRTPNPLQAYVRAIVPPGLQEMASDGSWLDVGPGAPGGEEAGPETSSDSRRRRRTTEDLRLLRETAAAQGVEKRLLDALDGAKPLAELLHPSWSGKLQPPPSIELGKQISSAHRHTQRATNARKIISAISKSLRLSDYERHVAIGWLITGLRRGLSPE